MSEDEFYQGVEEWHNGEGYSLEYENLHEYLGVTWEQYCKYVRGEFDE